MSSDFWWGYLIGYGTLLLMLVMFIAGYNVALSRNKREKKAKERSQ